MVLLLMMIGAFSINSSMFDLRVLVVMGVVGYLLRKLHFDLAPIALAMVLGPLAEKAFRQSLFMSRGDLLIFFQRPISAVLLAALVAVLFGPTLWSLTLGRRQSAPDVAQAATAGE